MSEELKKMICNDGDLFSDLYSTIPVMHQCNCKTNHALGLAKTIFEMYTESDIYSDKSIKRVPGTIIVKESKNRLIYNALAQFYPGPSKCHWTFDTSKQRLEWFEKCLRLVIQDLQNRNLRELCIPHKIGCTLAGGDWSLYYQVIQTVANEHPSLKIYVVQRVQRK